MTKSTIMFAIACLLAIDAFFTHSIGPSIGAGITFLAWSLSTVDIHLQKKEVKDDD
jgi:hypothetical protein